MNRTPIGILLSTFPERIIKTRSGKEKKVEYKIIAGSLKATNDQQGIVEGYLNAIGNIDYGLDRTKPGAFKRTLDLSYKRKNANKDQFLWPYLWNHDTNLLPPGGIFDAEEDAKGLYIKAQLNLDYQLGRDMYSSYKFGSLKKQSMGYVAHQTDYVREEGQLIRDLIEVEILEGSGVIFPMNDEADVTNVKSRSWQGFSSKGASGKTSWPLGDRNAAWDNDAAHKRIVAHFTGSNDKLDTAGMKSVHFWFDSSAPENVTSYKLLFCDVVSGSIKAMPRGIFACAGSHGVNAADIPDVDKTSIKSKIATYYKKMSKQFDDDSIKVPWDDSGKRGHRRMDRKDFNDVHQAGKAADSLEDWGDLINELSTTMIQIFGMGDSPQSDMQDCLEQFGQALMEEWLPKAIESDLGQYLNDQGYCDSSTYVPSSVQAGGYNNYGWMSRALRGSHKAGAAFSQANTDAVYQHMANLHAMADAQSKAMHDAADGLQEALNGLGAPSNPSWREQGTTTDDEKSRRRAPARKAGAEFSQDNLQMLGEHVSDLHDVADTIHQMAEDLAQNTGASTYTDPDGKPDDAKETDKNKASSRFSVPGRTHSLPSTAVPDGDFGAALSRLDKLTVKK